MTRVNATTYTYAWTVGANDGTQTFTLSQGQDLAGNTITATPTSGASIIVDNRAPTATLAYTYGTSTNTATLVNQDTSITITAAFSEAMKGSPAMRIASTGAHTLAAANMTRVNATSYTYAWTVGTGDGIQTFTLSQGQDLAGNTITATPTAGTGASVTVDNTAPSNQDTVFAASRTVAGSATVTITSSGVASNSVWFAPTGTTTFSASSTITRAASGTATSITAPTTGGTYKLFVRDSVGNVSSPSAASLTVDTQAPTNQNTVFAASRTVAGGATVPIISSGAAGNSVWFAPAGTTNFVAGNTITRATGTATSIAAPTTAGTYKLFIQDSVGNVSSPSTASLTVDNTAPTATLAYTYGTSTNTATRVNQDTSITITAAFSKNIAATPAMRINGTGAHTVSAANMTRVNATTYTYAWTVGANDGTQTFTLSQGTDLAGNPITATPTSGASIIVDNTAPTATLTYTYTYGTGTDIATLVNQGTTITITAVFSESIKGNPAMRIDGTGAHTVSAANMTRVNATSYTYAWTVGAGDGIQTFTLSQGQDLTGNTVTATPTAGTGASITVDNTAPSNQDTVFAASRTVASNATVTITSSGVASNSVWFAPTGTTTFSASNTITQAASGTATSITAPTTGGDYKLFIQDSAGNVSSPSTATLSVDTQAPTNQDTVFAADVSSVGSATVAITSSGDASNSVWFAPAGTTNFVIGDTITRATGTATSIAAPSMTGDYKLFVQDSVGNVSSPSTATLTVDGTAPTAYLRYYLKQTGGNIIVSVVKAGDAIIVNAKFDEPMADSPVMQITGSGVENIAAANMTKHNATTYNYDWTVGAGDGAQSFTLSTGTDLAGNPITATPTAGTTITIDNTAPVPTVDALATNDTTPTITGTTDTGIALGTGESLSVTLNAVTYTPTVATDGTWSFTVASANALADGSYEVSATFTDATGNIGTDTSSNELAIDSTAPVLVSYAIGDGRQYLISEEATNVATNANIVLTFDEVVVKALGNGVLAIRSGNSNPTTETILSADLRITVVGNTVTIDPSRNFIAGESVSLDIGYQSLSDLAGNGFSFASFTDLFTTSATAATPTNQDTVFASAVSGMANAAITVVGSGNADDIIWFAPQSTQNFTEGTTITRAAGNATAIYAPQASGTYRLFVQDRAGNVSSPSNAVLTVTADTTSPSLTTYTFNRDNTSYALTDSATEVPANVDIILNFSERVSAGTGTITLTPTGGTAIALDVTGAQVTANDTDAVTINPSNNLDLSAEYTVNIPVGAFVDRASRDATQATFSFSVSATPPTPDPATVKDVVSGVNMQADIAVDWTKTSVTAITNRMNWLRRHKGSNNLSHQGITLNFAHPTLDALFKAEYKANNPKENSLMSQARLANMARTLANNTKHNADHSTSVFAALKQELSDRAANEFAKLAHNTLDNTLGHLTALNPLSGNSISDSISDTWAIWTAGNVTLGDYDATTTTSAQDSFSQNISLGVDKYTANDTQLLGVAVSLGRGDVEIGNNDTTLNSDAISFAVYTALDLYKHTVFEGMTAIEGMIGVGGITVDTKRRGNDNILLTGSRDIRQIFASLTFRGKFQQEDINLSPYGRVNVSHSRLGDFSESGSDFALTYSKQDINNLVLYTGLDVDCLIELNKGALRPFGVVEYGADISPSSDAELYYLSDPTRRIYTLSTDGSATHNLKFGIGIEYKAQTGAYGSVGYERTEIIDSGHTDSFDLEVGLEF